MLEIGAIVLSIILAVIGYFYLIVESLSEWQSVKNRANDTNRDNKYWKLEQYTEFFVYRLLLSIIVPLVSSIPMIFV